MRSGATTKNKGCMQTSWLGDRQPRIIATCLAVGLHFARTSWGYPQIIQVMDDHDLGSHESVLKHIETYILKPIYI